MHGDIDNFIIDLSGFTDEELESEGRVPPGKYHAIIQSVKEDKDSKSRCLLLKMLTLAGTNAEGVGLIHTEKLYLTDKNVKRCGLVIKRFGLGKAGAEVGVNWTMLTGRQVVIEIIEEDYEHTDEKTKVKTMRKSSKGSFGGIWPADDERVGSVPKSKNVPAVTAPAGQSSAAANGRQPALAGVAVGAVGAVGVDDDLKDM